jgi:hypothetical protein
MFIYIILVQINFSYHSIYKFLHNLILKYLFLFINLIILLKAPRYYILFHDLIFISSNFLISINNQYGIHHENYFLLIFKSKYYLFK